MQIYAIILPNMALEAGAKEIISKRKMALFRAVGDISSQLVYSTQQSPTYGLVKDIFMKTNHTFRMLERERLAMKYLLMSEVVPLLNRKIALLSGTGKVKLSRAEMGQAYAGGIDSGLFLCPEGDDVMLAYAHLFYARLNNNVVVSVIRGFPNEKALDIPKVRVFPYIPDGAAIVDFVEEVSRLDHPSIPAFSVLSRVEHQNGQPIDVPFATAVRKQELSTAAEAIGLAMK